MQPEKLDATPERCPSCGSEVRGRFCSRCGERQLEPAEFSLRTYLARLLSEIANVDSKLVRSFGRLMVRPGFLTMEYMRGRRVPYLRPVQTFLLANLVYFILQPYTGYSGYNTTLSSQMTGQVYSDELGLERVILEDVARRDVSLETYAATFDAKSEIFARTLVFLMIPFFALVVTGLYWRSEDPFVKHLIFAVHYYAWELAFVFSLFLLVYSRLLGGILSGLEALGIDPAAGGWTSRVLFQFFVEFPTLPLILPYLYLATRRVYGQGKLLSLAKSVVLVLALGVITAGYRLILFWVTYFSL